MTQGPENFGNGVAKTEDRFAGQLGGYRPRNTRDSRDNSLGRDSLSGESGSDELAPRNGVPTLDRSTPLDIANPIASTLTPPKLPEPPSLSGLREPTFPPPPAFSAQSTFPVQPAYPAPTFTAQSGLDGWLDSPGTSVVEHPLLRGLLLELPPKGAAMQAEWLDRWFEAARSIFELLYSFEGVKRP